MSRPFACRRATQRPEVTFAELIQPKVSEILVHHEISRDSGSVQQENFVSLENAA